MRHRGVVLQRREPAPPTQVSDRQPQPWMSLGDARDLGKRVRCQQGDRDIGFLGLCPKPVDGACIVLSSFPRAMLIMAGSFGLWRARLISNSLFAVGVAVVVLVLLGGTTWLGGGFWAPDGAYSRFFSPMIGLVWIVAASRILSTRSPEIGAGWWSLRCPRRLFDKSALSRPYCDCPDAWRVGRRARHSVVKALPAHARRLGVRSASALLSETCRRLGSNAAAACSTFARTAAACRCSLEWRALRELRIQGVAYVVDLTERKRAQEALNRASAELAHVSRMTALSALTASIAHEVNQPLSGIITNAGTCCGC
jgi:signal transduction histidine kinase